MKLQQRPTNGPVTLQVVFKTAIDNRKKKQSGNARPPVKESYTPLATVLMQ